MLPDFRKNNCRYPVVKFISLLFVASFQDLKKYMKKKKVAWLVMSSAVLLQVMISWMISWVLDYIDYGRTGNTLIVQACLHFVFTIYCSCLHAVASFLVKISDWSPNWIHFLEWSILMLLVGQVSITCAMIISKDLFMSGMKIWRTLEVLEKEGNHNVNNERETLDLERDVMVSYKLPLYGLVDFHFASLSFRNWH